MDGDLRNVRVWCMAMDLADHVYDAADKLPAGERFILNEQMRKAALSVPSNIAEGKGRGAPREYRQFVRYARGSAFELQSHIAFAKKRSYFTADTAQQLIDETDVVVRTLNALIRYLNRKARKPPVPDPRSPMPRLRPRP
jgi:four helix bundle protein